MLPALRPGVVIGLLMLASLDARQSSAPAAARADMLQYYALASQYLEGGFDRAVSELLTRTPNTGREIVAMAQRDWSVDVLRAAAMLETEAGFASGSLRQLTERLGHARTWLSYAQRRMPRNVADTFTPRWYATVGRKLLATSVAADNMLVEARREFDDDAGVLLVYGFARETTAFVADGQATLEALAARRSMFLFQTDEGRTRALLDARDALQRVLRLDPQSVEAQLRLAHVYLRLDDERRAVPLLERLIAGNPPAPYAYVSALLLGGVRARAGQLQDAIDLYLAARAREPGGQSAYIAHAQALHAAGQPEAAAEVLGAMLSRPAQVDDPWMQYPKGFELAAADLGPLRQLLREP